MIGGGGFRRHRCLLLAEGLAVSALIHGGVGLMGAHQNPVQRAVVLGVAMVCAGLNSTFDALIGMAVHHEFLLFFWCRNSMSSFHFSIRAVAFRKKI